MSIKTCPNCGRQFESQFDWPKTCSSEYERAWTAKRVTAAATMATALELQKQTKMMQEAQARAEAQAQEAAMAEIAEKKAIADEAAKKCGFSSAEEVLYWQKQAGPGADINAAIRAKQQHEDYKKYEQEVYEKRAKAEEKKKESYLNKIDDNDKIKYAKIQKLCLKIGNDTTLRDIFFVVLFPIIIIVLRNFIPFLRYYGISFLLFFCLGVSIVCNCIFKNISLNRFVKKIISIKGDSKNLFMLKEEHENEINMLCQITMLGILASYFGIALIILSIISYNLRSVGFNIIATICFIVAFIIFCAIYFGGSDVNKKIEAFENKRIYEKYGYKIKSKDVDENDNEKLDNQALLAIRYFHDNLKGDFSGCEFKDVFNNFIGYHSHVTYKEYHEFIEYFFGKEYEDVGELTNVFLTKYKKKFSIVDDEIKKIYLDIQAKYKRKAEKVIEKFEERPINKKNKDKCWEEISNLYFKTKHIMQKKLYKYKIY